MRSNPCDYLLWWAGVGDYFVLRNQRSEVRILSGVSRNQPVSNGRRPQNSSLCMNCAGSQKKGGPKAPGVLVRILTSMGSDRHNLGWCGPRLEVFLGWLDRLAQIVIGS